MYLLHKSPPRFSRLTNVLLEHLEKGVLDVCYITGAVYDYKTHHIRMYDYRVGSNNFLLLMMLSRLMCGPQLQICQKLLLLSFPLSKI